MTQKDYEDQLAAWEKARFAPQPEPPLTPITPTLIEKVPMRDGKNLYTEIFLPTKTSNTTKNNKVAYPVILVRSPYPFSRPSRTGRRPIERYLAENYAFVFQLTRGQGKSEGTFHFFKDDINDGYDAIQWIAEQPWCNGNVGMQGSSYLGGTQLLAARACHPALKCIMPTAFIGNYTHCFPFSYGVPKTGRFMQWLQVVDAERWDDVDVAYCDMNALNHPKWGPAFNHRPLIEAADAILSGDKLDCWRENITNPQDNTYWASVHFTDEELAKLDIPIFITDGWYDTTIGPIEFFSRLEKIQPNRDDRYLLIGPWNHYQTASTLTRPGDNDGDRVLPENGVVDMQAQRLAFFNRYLKNDHTVTVQKDRVRVYISGAKKSNVNKWFYFPTFPVPATKKKHLYLSSQGDAHTFPGNGTLSWAPPTHTSTSNPVDHYTYDPALPTRFAVETFLDRRDTEIRSDVLTYTSEPLTKPLTILGEIILVLYAASDAPDTDWFSVITEVFTDGQSKSFHYAPPAFRARYREGLNNEVFLTPDKPEEFRIPMGPAGHQIAAGNRLRLSIFSAAFPEFSPNSNTGNVVSTDVETRIAKQTIYHDVLRPSHIILPLIEIT